MMHVKRFALHFESSWVSVAARTEQYAAARSAHAREDNVHSQLGVKGRSRRRLFDIESAVCGL